MCSTSPTYTIFALQPLLLTHVQRAFGLTVHAQVNVVLDTIRPFLSVAGGTIDIAKLGGVKSVQPLLTLRLAGSSSSIQSIKMEIMQRIQRHFMTPGLRIEFEGPPKRGLER